MQVIIPDLPGFGKSQEPQKSWSLDDYVEWVKEFSEKIPGLDVPFCVVGHSFGGALAAKFSIKYVQNVKKLFLVAAACVRKRTWYKKMLYRLSQIIKVFSFLPYYAVFRKAFYKFVIRKSDYPYASGVMKETLLKIISDDLSHKVGFLKIPTVLIWGDKDTSTPMEQGEFIHKKIPYSKLITISGANHALEIEVPAILAQKILENI